MSAQITYDWQATAPDAFFTQGIVGDRWSDGVTFLSTAPGTNNVLRFNNNHFLVTNNNSGVTYDIHGLEFAAGNTSSRQITGNSFRLRNVGGITPYIQNLSTASMRIDNGINGDVAAQVVEIRALNGNLDFRGSFNTQGSTVRLISNTGRDLYFNSTISGTGSITVLGGGVVRFNGANSYSGFTRVENGELWGIRNGNVFNDTNPNFIGNAAEPSLRAAFYIARSAGAPISNTFTIEQGNAGMRILGGRNTSGAATFSGIITHNTNSELLLDAVNSGALMYMTNDITGIGSVVISGNGIVEYISNAKTYTGFTRFDSGVFRLGSPNMISDASNFVFNGGIFSTGSTTGFSETVGTLKLTNNSTIALGTGAHTLTFANSSAIVWDLTKTLTITGYLGPPSSVGKIQIGVGGLTNDQLARITFDGLAPGARITSTGQLLPATLTTYYSSGSTSPHLLTSWNSASDGSGVAPTTFNNAANYIVQSGHNMVNTTTWTNNAAGSNLTVSSGASLTTPAAIVLSSASLFTLEANATYIHDNSSAFATTIYAGETNFHSSSTVEYRNWASTGPAVSTYGNIIFNDTTSAVTLSIFGAITTVAGNFTVLSTGTTSRDIYLTTSTGVDTFMSIGGNLTISGGILNLTNGTRDISLNVAGQLILNGGRLELSSNGFGGQGTIVVNGDTNLTSGVFMLGASITVGGGYLIMNGSNVNFSTGLSFAGNAPNNGSGFYFNQSGVVNFTAGTSFSSSLISSLFFYNALNVTSINETYNGIVEQFTVSGSGSSTPLSGYSAWPTIGTTIKNFTVNNSVSLTLNNNKVVNGDLFLQNGQLILANFMLTYQGTSFTRTSGQINASGTSDTLNLNNTSLLTLPTNLFNGSIRNLTVSGNGGVKANQNLTIAGVLNLAGTNPNDTDGLLDLVINYGIYASSDSSDSTNSINNLSSYVLTMNSTGTTIGNGDVTGKISRTAMSSNVAYTFGNANMILTFNSSGTCPTAITVTATRGNEGLHNAKGNAVKRLYQIVRTGGTSTNLVTIRIPYEDAVLNGNSESELVIWSHAIPFAGTSPFEQGSSSEDSTQNWIQLNSQSAATLPVNGDVANTKYWMLSNQLTGNVKWLGTVSNAWATGSNWSSGSVPDATVSVIIPPSSEYNIPLTLSGTMNVKTIRISETAVVNSTTTAQLYIHGGPSDSNSLNSWNNQGTFNASTSNIRFNSSDGTIAGATDFYNITIESGKLLTVTSDAIVGVLGSINNNGILDATSFVNTFVYKSGSTENISQPNGPILGFHNLTINKTGGDANQSGTIDIYGTLNLLNSNYNVGSNILRLYGPYITGNVNLLRTTTSSILEYNNSGTGTVNLTNSTTINNITFNSNLIYNLTTNTTVSGNLSLTNATLNLNGYTMNRNLAGGTLTLGNNANLLINSTLTFPANYNTHSINSTSTVNYNGGSQVVGNLNSGQSYGNLLLSGTGVKTMSGLTSGISGDFIITGTALATLPTTINFNGNSSQEIEGLVYQNINFSGNGAKVFNNNASIGPDNNISFGAGSGSVDFDGVANDFEFTLNSSASSTAIIGNVGGFTLQGNVISERYMLSKRAFRFITSAVNTTTTINDNWQEGQTNPDTSTNSNTNPGFGMHISGAGGAANGFDPNASNSASMFGFNNFSQSWSAISNTNVNTLTAGSPYRILVRGDRSINLQSNSAPSTVTTLRATGTLSQGNQVVASSIDPSFVGTPYVFVGNPYHAPVNMQTILSSSSNLNTNFMYVWDAQLGTRGGYTTVNVVNNTSSAGGNANRYLQIGQAVFLEASGLNPSLTFIESAKFNTTNESILRTSDLTISNSLLKIKLHEANNYAIGANAADGLIIEFGNEYSNFVDAFDAKKLGNLDEEFSSKVNDTLLSYQSRNYPSTNEFIQLNNLKYRNQNYVMELDFDFIPNMNTYLLDQFSNELTLLTEGETTLYSFTVDATNDLSKANDRFRIVFEPSNVLSNPIMDLNAQISLYPNPNEGKFSIKLPEFDNASIQIYNTIGQQVYGVNNLVSQEEIQIDATNELVTGTYFVHIVMDEVKIIKKILVK